MVRFLLIFFSLSLFSGECRFCIVIPSYNNSQWYKQNLDSIFNQDYQNYHVIYIDDASTDGTADLVKNYVAENNRQERFTLLLNRERQGQLACVCQAVSLCDKSEVVIDVNGDDWLAHNEVLSDLNQIYADKNVWMTYGQFVRHPSYKIGFAHSISQETIENQDFRNCKGAVTHLRTYYAALFQEIDRSDFLFEGEFIKRAGDLAYTIPMLEMAKDKSRFISDILYVYNYTFPMHVDKEPNDLELQMDHYIRSKTPYSPLEKLPFEKALPIYSQVSNLKNPSLQDYRFVQDYLSFGKRDKIENLADMTWRVKNFKIIGTGPSEYPFSGKITVNCSEEDKENCVLIYASFNDRYPQGLERLLNHIKESDFKGHILYRLGGWPNEEEGDLVFAHTPYSFKSAFFKEAQNKGYKKVLWLDTSVIPLVSLNEIFQTIENKGYFVMGNTHQIYPYSNPLSNAYFGLNHAYTNQIPSCSSGLFGVDLSKPLGKTIVKWWRKGAFDKDAYYCPRSDQNVLSIILHQLGIYDFVPISQMPHSRGEIGPDSLFLLDRRFVH